MGLSGKKIIIFGGSSGMGLATAKLAKEQGALVTIVGRSAQRLRDAANLLGGVETEQADIADESAVQRTFEHFDHVDHVYVSSGVGMGGGILENDIAHYRPAIEERLWGAAYVIRAAAGKMKAGGSITLTGAISTDHPVGGLWITNVGTAAVEQLARAAAIDLAPIRVNAVAPGWTDTPMWDGQLGEARNEVFSAVSGESLIGRLVSADEVGAAVLHLMTNNGITGEVLHIDGGHRLRRSFF